MLTGLDSGLPFNKHTCQGGGQRVDSLQFIIYQWMDDMPVVRTAQS